MALGTRYSLKVIAIATIAGAMGVVAALLGFVAERNRITVDEIFWDDATRRCTIIGPAAKNKLTLSLSMAAALLVLLVQVLLTAAGGGCLCCNYKIDKLTSPAPLAIKSLFVSWALCVVAVVVDVYAAGMSSSSSHHARPNSHPRPYKFPASTPASCGYAINSGVLASAAVMALLATASGITSYLAASRVYLIHIWLGHGPKFCVKLAETQRAQIPTQSLTGISASTS